MPHYSIGAWNMAFSKSKRYVVARTSFCEQATKWETERICTWTVTTVYAPENSVASSASLSATNSDFMLGISADLVPTTQPNFSDILCNLIFKNLVKHAGFRNVVRRYWHLTCKFGCGESFCHYSRSDVLLRVLWNIGDMCCRYSVKETVLLQTPTWIMIVHTTGSDLHANGHFQMVKTS